MLIKEVSNQSLLTTHITRQFVVFTILLKVNRFKYVYYNSIVF